MSAEIDILTEKLNDVVADEEVEIMKLLCHLLNIDFEDKQSNKYRCAKLMLGKIYWIAGAKSGLNFKPIF